MNEALGKAVVSAAQRLGDRSLSRGNTLGQNHQVATGNCIGRNLDVLSESAVHIDTECTVLVTQMELAVNAAIADTAADVGLHSHLHTLLVEGNILAHLHDSACKLVTKDQRMLLVSALSAIEPHTNVSAANGSGVSLQQDLIVIDLGNGNFLQTNVLRTVKSKC